MNWVLYVSFIVLLLVVFVTRVLIHEARQKEINRNHPPEICRIENWHLIDKVRIYDFLKTHLEELGEKDE